MVSKKALIKCSKCILSFALLFQLFTSCEKKESNRFQGYVEGEYIYIATSQPGRLDHLDVHRGEVIEAGAFLFALEHENESAELKQAEDQLLAAKSQWEDLQTGKRPAELNVYRAQLDQAIAAEQLSSTELNRDKEQFLIGAISQSQLDSSLTRYAQDQGKVAEAYNQLQSGELPGRKDQIKAQMAQVAASHALVAQAQWKLSQKIVESGHSGFIFDTLYVEGEWVDSGNPVVSLLPPENIKVRFFVPENTLGSLSLGQVISIHCDGCEQEIDAKISYISPQAEYTPPIIFSNETRSKLIYMIEARPSSKDATLLHPGQPVEVALHGK